MRYSLATDSLAHVIWTDTFLGSGNAFSHSKVRKLFRHLQVLKNGYAREKEYVYWLGSKLTDDPDESFMILKSPYSKTNKTVFLNHIAIEGAPQILSKF